MRGEMVHLSVKDDKRDIFLVEQVILLVVFIFTRVKGYLSLFTESLHYSFQFEFFDSVTL